MSQSATPAKVEMIKLDSIDLEVASMVREGLDTATVDEYAEAMLDDNPTQFPPVVVYRDGKVNRLADGWHRVEAARKASMIAIAATVFPGDRRDALRYALSANARHGRRRTRQARWKTVMAALKDPELRSLSDRELARLCEVSQPFVGTVRRKAPEGEVIIISRPDVIQPGQVKEGPASDPVSAPPLPQRLDPTPTPEPQPPALAGHSEADSQGDYVPGTQDRLAETADLLQGALEEIESLHRIIDAEDLLDAYHREVKRADARARVAEIRVPGLMNKAAELTKFLKASRGRYDRLIKRLTDLYRDAEDREDPSPLVASLRSILEADRKEKGYADPSILRKGA